MILSRVGKDPYPHGSRGTPDLRDGTHDIPAVWYAAYASNTRWEGLRRYLGPGAALPPDRWITIPHALYFAGASRRWDGGVAFVTAAAGPPTPARAWHLSAAQLHAVAAAENGGPLPPLPAPAHIAVGGAARLTVDLSPDGTLGKYDLLLRLPDIAGDPAVTLTTSRALAACPPGAAYLAACRAGLAGGGVPDLDAYLAAAVARDAPAG